eukprot:scaffold834_cov244-Pinguiococcus_pyrenoidosus.AAC.16
MCRETYMPSANRTPTMIERPTSAPNSTVRLDSTTFLVGETFMSLAFLRRGRSNGLGLVRASMRAQRRRLRAKSVPSNAGAKDDHKKGARHAPN